MNLTAAINDLADALVDSKATDEFAQAALTMLGGAYVFSRHPDRIEGLTDAELIVMLHESTESLQGPTA